jgi:hypothetical protein
LQTYDNTKEWKGRRNGERLQIEYKKKMYLRDEKAGERDEQLKRFLEASTGTRPESKRRKINRRINIDKERGGRRKMDMDEDERSRRGSMTSKNDDEEEVLIEKSSKIREREEQSKNKEVWIKVGNNSRKKKDINKKDTGNTHKQQAINKTSKKVPRSSAVTITCTGNDYSYANALKRTRSTVSLNSIGIEKLVLRRAITGGINLEIPRTDNNNKAIRLENKLKEVFRDTGVVINRPQKKAEIRIFNLDDSITTEEIKDRLMKEGNCYASDIKCGEIRKTRRNGLGSIWIQCPVAVAVKLAEKGSINIGWSEAKVMLLKNRPLQCFKCLAVRHTVQRCLSEKDRNKMCFRCGEEGHRIKDCKNRIKCPMCMDRSMKADCRVGSELCPSCPPRDFSPWKSREHDAREVSMMEESQRDRRPGNDRDQ